MQPDQATPAWFAYQLMKLLTNELTTVEKQYYLQHIVAPRPICFASTVDREGNVNLSPFSFFNLFSSNPPIVIFSPARRVRDNTTKHTLENLREVPEVVINIATYDIVQQVSLASCEYPKGTDEFVKAGFTKETATLVQPPMVRECKAKLECRVTEIKALGAEGGAGNLVIAEVLAIHINDDLLDGNNKFQQEKLDLVARLGGDWYAKITRDNLFRIEKPNVKLGIGLDMLPEHIKNSKILSGNHLGQLANVHEYPKHDAGLADQRLEAIVHYFKDKEDIHLRLHQYAKELLDEGDVHHAWQVLLFEDNVQSKTEFPQNQSKEKPLI